MFMKIQVWDEFWNIFESEPLIFLTLIIKHNPMISAEIMEILSTADEIAF